jgi:hypothetical protein
MKKDCRVLSSRRVDLGSKFSTRKSSQSLWKKEQKYKTVVDVDDVPDQSLRRSMTFFIIFPFSSIFDNRQRKKKKKQGS